MYTPSNIAAVEAAGEAYALAMRAGEGAGKAWQAAQDCLLPLGFSLAKLLATAIENGWHQRHFNS